MEPTRKKAGNPVPKQEALRELLNDKEYIKTLPEKERNKLYAYKSMLKRGTRKLKNPDKVLARHGYICVQPSIWQKVKEYQPEKEKQPRAEKPRVKPRESQVSLKNLKALLNH